MKLSNMMFKSRPIFAVAVTLSTLLFAAAPSRAQPSPNGKTFTVNTANDSGETSLRAAILYANAHPGTIISFSDDTVSLTVASELPAITGDKTIIDGGELKRDLLGPVTTGSRAINGLTLRAADCVVRRFYLNGFVNAIYITGQAARRNLVEACVFGIQRNLSRGPFSYTCVRIDSGATGNLIGGAYPAGSNDMGKAAAASTTMGTVQESAVVITGNGTNGNLVPGNLIASSVDGIVIADGAQNNSIGGSAAAVGNAINGCVRVAISVLGVSSTGNRIQGNGIIYNGSNNAPGYTGGIALIGSVGTLIGGTTTEARNYISANANAGIWMEDSSSNTIQGNYIGTDATGNSSFKDNARTQIHGILMRSGKANIIGGAQPGAGNLISGNDSIGLRIDNSRLQSAAEANVVQGNRIGTNAAGTRAVPNNYGIFMSDNTVTGAFTGCFIGGDTPASGNLISGNNVALFIGRSQSNRLAHNYVGTEVTGQFPIPNNVGIAISQSTGNVIGLSDDSSIPGGPNRIAFNAYQGIVIAPEADGPGNPFPNTTVNKIRGNAIWDNGGLGIDLAPSVLGNGITANDTGDADTGPNGYQNYPVITSVTIANGRALVSGTLNSRILSSYTLDFYGSTTVDSSGDGEGRVYLGTTAVNSDANGDATFSISVTPSALSRYVTATATSLDGTSEFARAAILPSSVHFNGDGNYLVYENSGFGTAIITVSRSGSTASAFTVGYTMADGTAKAGTDYVLASGTLSFAAGEAQKTFSITIINDNNYEPNETVRLILRTPTGGAVVGGTPSQATLTILNDDPAPRLAIGDAVVTEGAAGTTSLAQFGLFLSTPATQTVTVRYGTSNGTAAQGVDYTYSSGIVTFNPGESSKSITVPVRGDAAIEPNETFTVTLVGPVNATLSRHTALATINNDDFPTISTGDATTTETAPANFTVTLSAPVPFPVRVGYTTLNNTAVAPADYQATGGTLEFLPGEVTKIVTVPVANDSTFEATENFRLVLSSAFNATLARGIGVGIITDNDVAPALSISDAEATEGSGPGATVTVTLSAASGQQVIVRYATSNGTAKQPDDYTTATGTLVFAPGETSKTINIAVQDDAISEANETFGINLVGPVNATLARAQGIVTILDNDSAQ